MRLAINGGKKITDTPFPDQYTIGEEEQDAINCFLGKRTPLSGYRGNWIPAFWGGKQVKEFEDYWSEYFDYNYSVAVNSCTSALQIACHAIGLSYGDEVIVTPWSMSCSASAPLICGAKPVFADIEREQFCLDIDSVKEKITSRTKAIIAVSLFGSPINPELYLLAKTNGLYLIEDCAQAPGAQYLDSGMYSGKQADICCFSFTQGKHMTCGEGGMISTDDELLAMRCAAIRNHAEAVVSAIDDISKAEQIFGDISFVRMPGYNMRMTELNATIMQEQLSKLDWYIKLREYNVKNLYKKICQIPFISKPTQREDTRHAHYVQPFLFDSECAGIHRDVFVKAVAAELTGEMSRPDRPMLGSGYITPLYRMPIFAYYHVMEKLPVVEKLWSDDFFLSMYHNLPLDDGHIDLIAEAFCKVANNIDELKNNSGNTKIYWRNI